MKKYKNKIIGGTILGVMGLTLFSYHVILCGLAETVATWGTAFLVVTMALVAVDYLTKD